MADFPTRFKPGNKAAFGNPNSGRPREFLPEDEAKELMKWADLPDSLILRAFAPSRGYSSKLMYKWEEESSVFMEAMDYARDKIGCRREEYYIKQGNVRPYERYAAMYDQALHKFERAEKEFEMRLKSTIDDVSEDIQTKFDECMKKFLDLQIDLSIASNNTSTDSKSE